MVIDKDKYITEEEQRKLSMLLGGIANKKLTQQKFIKLEKYNDKFVLTYMADSPITNFKKHVYEKYIDRFTSDVDFSKLTSLYSMFFIFEANRFIDFIRSLEEYANE